MRSPPYGGTMEDFSCSKNSVCMRPHWRKREKFLLGDYKGTKQPGVRKILGGEISKQNDRNSKYNLLDS